MKYHVLKDSLQNISMMLRHLENLTESEDITSTDSIAWVVHEYKNQKLFPEFFKATQISNAFAKNLETIQDMIFRFDSFTVTFDTTPEEQEEFIELVTAAIKLCMYVQAFQAQIGVQEMRQQFPELDLFKLEPAKITRYLEDFKKARGFAEQQVGVATLVAQVSQVQAELKKLRAENQKATGELSTNSLFLKKLQPLQNDLQELEEQNKAEEQVFSQRLQQLQEEFEIDSDNPEKFLAQLQKRNAEVPPVAETQLTQPQNPAGETAETPANQVRLSLASPQAELERQAQANTTNNAPKPLPKWLRYLILGAVSVVTVGIYPLWKYKQTQKDREAVKKINEMAEGAEKTAAKSNIPDDYFERAKFSTGTNFLIKAQVGLGMQSDATRKLIGPTLDGKIATETLRSAPKARK